MFGKSRKVQQEMSQAKADFEKAMDAFKIDDVPEEYYSSDYIPGGSGWWVLSSSMEVPTQVYVLLRHLSREPEFQLK